MNEDILQGKWKQVRAEVRKWWARVTDDDLDYIAGERERLMGVLQERYGYTREKAKAEIEKQLEEFQKAVGRVGARHEA